MKRITMSFLVVCCAAALSACSDNSPANKTENATQAKIETSPSKQQVPSAVPATQAPPTKAPATQKPTAPVVKPNTKPTSEPVLKPSPAATKAPKNQPVETKDWEASIKSIATSDQSTTEKADAAEALARDYTPGNQELLEYFIYLAQEFTNDTYLNQIENDEYMLANIFKSVLVEKYAKNDDLKDFAFDFYQNTKYTYRGADSVDSDSVISNEKQMLKALSNINPQ